MSRRVGTSVLAVLAVAVAGCASTSSSSSSGSSSMAARAAPALQRPVDFDAGRPAARRPQVAEVSVPRPRSPAEAGLLVGEAMGCLQRGDKAGAIPRLQALLGSDYLSERGRANLYWLLADAADGLDDERRRDALGGYLVAASILPVDAELRDRMGRARAWLLADDVHARALGTSPATAIDVDSVREADVVVAALHCGHRGGRYVVRPAQPRAGAVSDPGDSLAARRLLCTETGDELVLWFRLPRSR